jgi:hypothetical protein
MSKYIVTKEDLKGQIANFPVEIVQAMVDEQVRQTGKANVAVFQRNKMASTHGGGFDWDECKDHSIHFWADVIGNENFSTFSKPDTHVGKEDVVAGIAKKFIEKIVNRNEKEDSVFYVRVGETNEFKNHEVIKLLESKGGNNVSEYDGSSENSIYFIEPETNNIEIVSTNVSTSQNDTIIRFVNKFGVELFPEVEKSVDEDILSELDELRKRIEELNKKLNK